ncbi:MAG: hypothetical protein RR623_04690 [Bacilli bacterium]
MKTIIQYSSLFLMFIITLLVIIDINFISSLKSEMSDVISISERNVLKGNKINKIYDPSAEDLSLELIRNIGSNSNVDANLEVSMYEVSAEGLVDVSLKGEFKHLNGKEDTRSIRETMLVERFDK